MALIFRMAKFPIVCSNYDFTGTPVEGTVRQYVVIKRSGVRIGVFGLCPQLDGLVDAQKCQGVRYLDPVDVAGKMTALLRHDLKCDIVVCLSHLGWLKPTEQGDQYLISHTKDIDVVLGGHSHTTFNELLYVTNSEVKEVGVDQNGKSGIYVGKLILNLDKCR